MNWWSGDPNIENPKFPFFTIIIGSILLVFGLTTLFTLIPVNDDIEVRYVDSYMAPSDPLGLNGDYTIIGKTPALVGTKNGWNYMVANDCDTSVVWLLWDLDTNLQITFFKPMFSISEDMKND
jgi:hypothetical protein